MTDFNVRYTTRLSRRQFLAAATALGPIDRLGSLGIQTISYTRSPS